MAVKAKTETNRPRNLFSEFHALVRKLVFANAEKAYTSKTGEKSLRVSTQMSIFLEVCETLGLGYRITPKFISTHPIEKTVCVSVSVHDANGLVLFETFGTSTRHCFSLEESYRNSVIERAETIALGKALAKLGITLGAMHSMDEIQDSIEVQDTINEASSVVRTKLASFMTLLPEDLKKKIAQYDIKSRELISLISSPKDTIDQFTERLENYLLARLETSNGSVSNLGDQ